MAWSHDPDRLTVVHPNAVDLPQELFAMLRRKGLGASDTAIYLGLQSKWSNTETLIKQKLATEYTEEEREVAAKVQVRMGRALEPLILQMWVEQFAHVGATLEKPKAMYAIKEFPYLTVNFDGVATTDVVPYAFPVEAKYITFFGDKYYNFDKADKSTDPYGKPRSTSVLQHCEDAGKHYGIPSYYYAQLQRQMYSLNSPIGYLAVIRSKDLSFHYFEVFADPWLQKQDIVQGFKVWDRIERQRNLLHS